MLQNKGIDSKCVACGAVQPGGVASGSQATGSETSQGQLQLGSSGGLKLGSSGSTSGGLQLGSSGGLKFGSSGVLQLGSSGGGLQLGSSGSQSLQAPPTTEPLKPLAQFAPAADGWSCDTCLVDNKKTDTSCVACSTPRPGLSGQQAPPTSAPGQLKKLSVLGSGSLAAASLGSGGGFKLGGGLKFGEGGVNVGGESLQTFPPQTTAGAGSGTGVGQSSGPGFGSATSSVECPAADNTTTLVTFAGTTDTTKPLVTFPGTTDTTKPLVTLPGTTDTAIPSVTFPGTTDTAKPLTGTSQTTKLFSGEAGVKPAAFSLSAGGQSSSSSQSLSGLTFTGAPASSGSG